MGYCDLNITLTGHRKDVKRLNAYCGNDNYNEYLGNDDSEVYESWSPAF